MSGKKSESLQWVVDSAQRLSLVIRRSMREASVWFGDLRLVSLLRQTIIFGVHWDGSQSSMRRPE